MPNNYDLGRVSIVTRLYNQVGVGLNPSSITWGFEQMAKPVSSPNYFNIWLRKLNEKTYIQLLA